MKKVCIVGCGAIGRLHAKNLQNRVNLYFHSRSVSSADAFNKLFAGSGVIEYYDDVLANGELDAVVICTPPADHAPQVVAALTAGKSVLVEKPMCVSAAEVDAVGRAMQGAAGFLMVAENYYYKPSLAKIRSLVEAGHLGKVRALDVKKVFTQESTGWKSGYGALLEGGIHFLALISGTLTEDPIKVNAEFPGRRNDEPERHSVTRLIYASGASAKLTYSWNTPSMTKGLFQRSVVEGSRGRITFESNGLWIRLNSKTKSGLYFPGLSDIMGYRAMTEDFLACLEDRRRQPQSDFRKAKRDLGVVFEAYDTL